MISIAVRCSRKLWGQSSSTISFTLVRFAVISVAGENDSHFWFRAWIRDLSEVADVGSWTVNFKALAVFTFCVGDLYTSVDRKLRRVGG